jgi:alpha-mannosidase
MFKYFAVVCVSVFFLYTFSFSQTNAYDPYKATLDRLEALTHQAEPEWRFHADIPHPEDPSVNHGDWGRYEVRNIAPGEGTNQQEYTGTRVFRRWIQIPENIDGYATQGSRVELNLRFTSPDTLMITVFSNGSVLYRGDDDNILPVLLTESAQPGQKFLVAARVVAKDTSRANFERAEIIIQPPASRPNPALLRLEFLAARPIITAYEDGKAQREQQLDAAITTVDFTPLEKGDQSGFDASVRSAHQKLEVLKPWMQQFTIRLVGNSHIDMAWLWPWTETVEVVRNTFRSVLDLMREYPDL